MDIENIYHLFISFEILSLSHRGWEEPEEYIVARSLIDSDEPRVALNVWICQAGKGFIHSGQIFCGGNVSREDIWGQE